MSAAGSRKASNKLCVLTTATVMTQSSVPQVLCDPTNTRAATLRQKATNPSMPKTMPMIHTRAVLSSVSIPHVLFEYF